MKILLVGGRFDSKAGRPSGYIRKLEEALLALSVDVECFNGGFYTGLRELATAYCLPYDAVLWFADVPNEEEKLVDQIKQRNPKRILVTSKRNELVDVVEGENIHEYPFQAVVAHALRLKSNLVVQFWHSGKVVCARLFDPLGNEYKVAPTDTQQLARVLLARIRDLRKFTRIKSVQVGPAVEVPDQEEFFKIIKLHAARFHELVNPQQTDRFLGNASFRCDKGFPSFREGNLIFVSRRNIDKRYVGPEAFVAVNADRTDQVEYYGEHKPSVDTPVQLRLYHYFTNINYMLHGHVYVDGGCEASSGVPIPCGAIEEVDHVTRFGRAHKSLGVNLKHHGCIVMSATAPDLCASKFEGRPVPEQVLAY